ncbi:uncharacterized protein H6S33_005045 [Morchella sextelata]|uniref:uncharacterized protein n=1 Tax=Morchella sextelata TaxID=1174677 RepID=UPI001D05367C|nr:uncharacterized protein H6S33_005045 [Morchella sextelata]KAH0605063.1 hypothetical protein H6S33_005045 [Morchella sextelata]
MLEALLITLIAFLFLLFLVLLFFFVLLSTTLTRLPWQLDYRRLPPVCYGGDYDHGTRGKKECCGGGAGAGGGGGGDVDVVNGQSKLVSYQ